MSHATLSSKPLFRGLFYLAGLLILALGITMNTKAGLGVSPIISVSYSVSTIWGHNFGNTTLLLYSAFVAAEMVLRWLGARQGKGTLRRCRAGGDDAVGAAASGGEEGEWPLLWPCRG